ncbi:hypothetical protein Rhe02_06120 [Rhizocola hellebori]|uniref:Uncharacterized protein n=1 Tax=Rhizocola hellebori TaxID=1392758 RepID=A0A8J3VDA2_9ACTN|nr:hypothetical protein Rhe02_06120 [Rhizocola hellebori]
MLASLNVPNLTIRNRVNALRHLVIHVDQMAPAMRAGKSVVVGEKSFPVWRNYVAAGLREIGPGNRR